MQTKATLIKRLVKVNLGRTFTSGHTQIKEEPQKARLLSLPPNCPFEGNVTTIGSLEDSLVT